MANWYTGDIVANGIKIHYHCTGGDKPALVIAHGVTDNGISWSRVARDLESDYDVIMYDRRGHGFSDAPQTGYTFDHHAEDLAELIVVLGLERPCVMGHSGGAAAAAIFAANHSGMLKCLVLVDPPWGNGWGSWDEIAAVMVHWFLGLGTKTREDLITGCSESNPDWSEQEISLWAETKLQVHPNVIQTFDQPSPSWRDTVSQITCPILLITGDPEKGAINTPEDVKEITALWRKGQAIHIEGAGHMIHYDRYDAFISAVQAFLAECKLT